MAGNNPRENENNGDQGDANRDPLSGAPGAHPVGTGVGAAAGGAAAGAAIGSVAGPVGTVIGTAAGAVIGGLAGKGIAENINPTEEHAYWRNNYSSRPYAKSGESYDDYGPAYQYGWESSAKHQGSRFEDVESSLQTDWEKAKGKSRLGWDRAKEAVRDSWDRVTHRTRSANNP